MSKLACKYKYIGKGRYTDRITQKITIDFDASVTDMNSIDRLSTSMVNENDRSRFFNHRDKLDRTAQIGHACHVMARVRARIACVNMNVVSRASPSYEKNRDKILAPNYTLM